MTISVENVLFYATKVLGRTGKVAIRDIIFFLLLMNYLNMRARKSCLRVAFSKYCIGKKY